MLSTGFEKLGPEMCYKYHRYIHFIVLKLFLLLRKCVRGAAAVTHSQYSQ